MNESVRIKSKESEKEVRSETIKEIGEKDFRSNYNNCIIYFIFGVIFLSNILINIDHGSLPGSTKQIEEKLGINDFEFGLLGTLVYIGIVMGSIVATILYSKGN